MSERIREQREQRWSDEIPEEEEERTDPFDETYWDGSAKNECWKSDR